MNYLASLVVFGTDSLEDAGIIDGEVLSVVDTVCTCEPMAGAFEIRDADCLAH